jgi:hypothetical protein
MVVHTCDYSYIGNINKRITVQARPGINMRSYSKNKAKKKKKDLEQGLNSRAPA